MRQISRNNLTLWPFLQKCNWYRFTEFVLLHEFPAKFTVPMALQLWCRPLSLTRHVKGNKLSTSVTLEELHIRIMILPYFKYLWTPWWHLACNSLSWWLENNRINCLRVRHGYSEWGLSGALVRKKWLVLPLCVFLQLIVWMFWTCCAVYHEINPNVGKTSKLKQPWLVQIQILMGTWVRYPSVSEISAPSPLVTTLQQLVLNSPMTIIPCIPVNYLTDILSCAHVMICCWMKTFLPDCFHWWPNSCQYFILGCSILHLTSGEV